MEISKGCYFLFSCLVALFFLSLGFFFGAPCFADDGFALAPPAQIQLDAPGSGCTKNTQCDDSEQCTADGCLIGTEQTEYVGDVTHASGSDDVMLGNVFRADKNVLVTEQAIYMSHTGTVPFTSVIYESATEFGTYTLVSSTTESINGTGQGWFHIRIPGGFPLEAGKYYAIGLSWDDYYVFYFYKDVSVAPEVVSFGEKINGFRDFSNLPGSFVVAAHDNAYRQYIKTIPGICLNFDLNIACDDGLFCNGDDSCRGGECVLHWGNPCDLQCATCVEAGNTCTALQGACDDGVFCNGEETCVAGECISPAIPSCDEQCQTCDDTDIEHTVGLTENEYTGADLSRGNTFEITTDTLVTGVSMYLDFSADMDMTVAFYEHSSATGTYAILYDETVGLVAAGEHWYTIDGLAVPLEAGKYYAIVFTWENEIIHFFNSETSGAEALPFGQKLYAASSQEYLPSSLDIIDYDAGYRQKILTPSGSCSDVSDGQVCDDGIFCNGDDECLTGVCDTHDGDPCPTDGAWCNGDEFCDEANTQCDVQSVPDCSDDGLFCTGDESCDETADLCVSSGDPCGVTETCDENADTCNEEILDDDDDSDDDDSDDDDSDDDDSDDDDSDDDAVTDDDDSARRNSSPNSGGDGDDDSGSCG